MKNQKAAIIGFGGMGQRHFRAYEKIGVEVIAIADIFPDKVRDIIPKLPMEHIYQDYRELLAKEEPDIVSVVTNGPTHSAISIAASNAGIRHIMCEKPMATRLCDAEEVIETCARNNTRIAVNHIRRWNSNYYRLKRLIQQGIIGDIRHIYFNCGSTGLGIFAIHFFDTIRYLTDCEPDWVHGFIDKTGTPNPRGKQYIDPGGFGIIKLKNGTRCFIDTSEDTGVQYIFQIVGTYGRIIIDELNNSWTIRARNAGTRTLPLTRYGSDMIQIPFESDADFDIVDLTSRGLAELLSDNQISSTGTDGKKSLEMVFAFHVSDELNNAKVTLPLTGDTLRKEIPIA